MSVDPARYITQNAAQYGLDPKAVLAYALEEGGLKWGAVGDKGTSFGPFQMHIGGANPYSDPARAAAFANSPEGLAYGMRAMGKAGAKGLTGAEAAKAIELNFGRGANPPETVRRALAFLPQAEDIATRISQMGNVNFKLKAGIDPNNVASLAQTQKFLYQSGDLSKAQDDSPQFKNLIQVNRLIEQTAPSAATQSILRTLGGTAATVAQRAAESGPIQLPKARDVGNLVPGVKLAVDHNQPLDPGVVPIVSEAKKWLGTQYSFGGGNDQGPTQGKTGVGFDCSGFIKYLYHKEYGIDLPHLASAQAKEGTPVGIADLQPGDLVFFHGKQPGHVGMYIGSGQFIHAPHTGDVVKISSLSDSWYQKNFEGGRRIVSGSTTGQNA